MSYWPAGFLNHIGIADGIRDLERLEELLDSGKLPIEIQRQFRIVAVAEPCNTLGSHCWEGAMTTTAFTTIDRRQKLPCSCGCGQEATLPHFTKVDGKLILPGCLDAHNERQASSRELREIVTRQSAPWQRVKHCGRVYRLQRGICARQPNARRAAVRSAVVYLAGAWVGRWVVMLLKKS